MRAVVPRSRKLVDPARDLVDQATADQATVDQATVDQATVDQATADQATVDQATVDQATADQATVDQATADQATVDQATVDQATADQATADRVEVAPATAAPAIAAPVTVVPVAAGLETGTGTETETGTETGTETETETETGTGTETETEMDRSAEQAFFAERDTVLSAYPMSFDAEPLVERFDLEGREQRRAFYARIVSGVVATLSAGVLLAFTRPHVNAAEAGPIAAVYAPAAEPAIIQPVEPVPALPEPAPTGLEPAAIASAVVVMPPPRASASGRPARVHARAVQAPTEAPHASVVHDDRPPPTARFAD